MVRRRRGLCISSQNSSTNDIDCYGFGRVTVVYWVVVCFFGYFFFVSYQ